MTMTGQQLYPMGELTFDDLVGVYREQAQALYDAGVDLFIVETMMSLQETRACVLAIKEVCDLPIMATLTFEKDGRTLYGTPPEAAVVVLQNLGVDAVGLNCSTGPADMVETVRKMYEYATIPLIAKPNAGLPELDGDKTVYKTTPEEFAQDGRLLIEAGAHIVGGCCGTTPDHIRALHEAVCQLTPKAPHASHHRVLASERQVVEIKLDGSFQVIGERINPTGKKKLQAELRAGKLDMVRAMAREQERNGASILDVNMGTNGIDEKEMMLKAIYEVTGVSGLPLSIDTSSPDIMEAALRIYPGRALVNSISCETEKRKKLLPVVKKYGAMFIALPVSDNGIPKTLEEKHAVLDELLADAYDHGFSPEDVVVDALVATVGAAPTSALDCMATFSHCKQDLGLATVCGLSNISFGLPDRIYVNATFLGMAIASGLTMAIANPSQDLLMNTAAAANMLMNKEGSDLAYIHRMQYFDKKEAERKRQEEAELLASHGTAGAVETAGSPKTLSKGRSIRSTRPSWKGKRTPSSPWLRKNWPRVWHRMPSSTTCSFRPSLRSAIYTINRFTSCPSSLPVPIRWKRPLPIWNRSSRKTRASRTWRPSSSPPSKATSMISVRTWSASCCAITAIRSSTWARMCRPAPSSRRHCAKRRLSSACRP